MELAQYKSFIDSIYGTITDKNMSDTDKSNIVINGIEGIMPKSTSKSGTKSKKTDDSEISCSSFTNTVVQFVCKLDKKKDKLCKILGSPLVWTIGTDKMNTVISFITTNGAFVDALWERSQMDDDGKQEITRLLNSLETNEKTKSSNSSSCIQNVQTLLKNLSEKSKLHVNQVESRPSSLTSLSSLGTSLTSGESRPSSTSSLTSGESRPSSLTSRESTSSSLTSGESRPSSMSSLTSVGSSGENKRYGQKFTSSPTLPRKTTTSVGESLNDEQKNPDNMWKDESRVYNPNNMWKDEEDFEGGKTRRKRYRNKKRKGTRKGKGKRKRTRTSKK